MLPPLPATGSPARAAGRQTRGGRAASAGRGVRGSPGGRRRSSPRHSPCAAVGLAAIVRDTRGDRESWPARASGWLPWRVRAPAARPVRTAMRGY